MVDQLLWCSSIGADAFALGVLLSRGLRRHFPVFLLFLLFNLVADLILKFIPGPATRIYAFVWMSSKPVILILWVLVVLELFRRVREHYPGIGGFARTLLLVTLVFASVVSALSLSPDSNGIDWRWPALHLTVLLDRYIGTVLAIFLFAMVGFQNYYHAPVRPNILRHGYIPAGYFSVQAIAMFLTNLMGATAVNANLFAGIFGTDAMTRINRGLITGSTACFLMWTFLLTRSGEGLPISAALSPSDLPSIERRDKELLDTLKWLVK